MHSYLDLPGASGDFVDTPDHASLRITGRLEIWADITPDDWSPSIPETVVGRWWDDTNNRSYMFQLDTDRTIRVIWSPDGTITNQIIAWSDPVPPSITDGSRAVVGFDLIPDTGSGGWSVSFAVKDAIGGSIIHDLRTMTGSGASSIFAGTSKLEVGSRSKGITERYNGLQHQVQVRNGGGGAVVAQPDFTVLYQGTTEFTDALGRTYTLHGNASIVGDPFPAATPGDLTLSPVPLGQPDTVMASPGWLSLGAEPVGFVSVVPTLAVSGWRPSAADLLDLIGVGRRFDTFEFELVDGRNRHLGNVFPDLERNPTVTHDTTREVHRSLDNFYLTTADQAQVNTQTDRVRVWMVLQNGARFSVGVFLWTDSNLPRRPWGYEREGTLLDKTNLLDHEIGSNVSLSRSKLILDSAISQIQVVPEFNDTSFVIDSDYRDAYEQGAVMWELARIGIEGVEREFNAPASWRIGSSRLTMLNGMMGLVHYMPVHADRNGTLILTYAVDIDGVQPDLFYSLDNGRIIEHSINRADDLLTAPNKVTVYDTSANNAPAKGVWTAPASAPYSLANRGFYRTKVVGRSGMATSSEAAREAKRIAQWLIAAGDWIEWDGPADPRHDAYDVVSVLDEKWLEVAWTLPCVGGSPMRHRALKVYPDEDTEQEAV